jgi:GT2 family glycosyltransferase
VAESLTARDQADMPMEPIRDGRETSFPCSIILPVDDAPPEALVATLESIANNTAGELFEVIIIDCSRRQEFKDLLSALGGDVKIVHGESDWNYSIACNRGAAAARGKYMAFLKPGLVVGDGWLEGLLEAAENQANTGVVGGVTLNENGLIWHVGIAFDANQAPFSIYRLLPREFAGVKKCRDFKALETPFLVTRELFCRLGGFSAELSNRFEDIDFCLRVQRAGLRVIFTPESAVTRQHVAWQSLKDQEQLNCIRFYSKWTGFIWQDDECHLQEDGLTHDALSALYRELAGRLAFGASQLSSNAATADL